MRLEQVFVTMIESIEGSEKVNGGGGKIHYEVADCLRDCDDDGRRNGGRWRGAAGTLLGDCNNILFVGCQF